VGGSPGGREARGRQGRKERGGVKAAGYGLNFLNRCSSGCTVISLWSQ